MMQIRISIEKTEPLSGTAATARSRPLPFAGWLELLRVISELVAAAGHAEDRSGEATDVKNETDTIGAADA